MKRIALTLLALVMLCSCALAETAQSTKYEFDDLDFTFEWIAETPVKKGYKGEGQSCLDVFPAGNYTVDAYPHFNVVWSSAAADIENITESELTELAGEYGEEIGRGFETETLKISQFNIREYKKRTVGGESALYLKALLKIDYSGMGEQYKDVKDLVMCQWVVCPAGKGCYTFTGTAENEEDLINYILPLVDSIRWKQKTEPDGV